MEPFTIHVPDDVLVDLKERLKRTRFPNQLDGAGWDYGTELGYLRELVDYWLNDFDWRAQEEALNTFSHFRMEVNGLGMHFIHERSPHEDALPLIITHGWPGSIFEFHKIISKLTRPEEYGGDKTDAFHVVCPSIPGYGFSDAPRKPGFDVKEAAVHNVALMEQLGYTRYGAQGGDWGSVISSWTAVLAPEQVCGLHLNMVLAWPPRGEDTPPELTEEEVRRLGDARKFQKEETGYQRIQGTKPQTLGYGLTDSPAGLAAWIVEKFRTWSDCNGDVESRFTKDELLTSIMIYWINENIASSTRLYYETYKAKHSGPPKEYVEAPTACAVFPKELSRLPRSWAERSYNITRWTEMPKGGHFAAMEEPDLLVEDIRAFFKTLR
ncbi:MAG: multidrug MFS transporter [Candidatus Hydrogenedentota bacterium]|nr:MAG: multidrug MFS transporter [Candidatus Hydrogenedentota bacterium]